MDFVEKGMLTAIVRSSHFLLILSLSSYSPLFLLSSTTISLLPLLFISQSIFQKKFRPDTFATGAGQSPTLTNEPEMRYPSLSLSLPFLVCSISFYLCYSFFTLFFYPVLIAFIVFIILNSLLLFFLYIIFVVFFFF